MKKLFCCILLMLLVSSHVWAQDAGSVKVEELVKSTSSWDGEILPAYGAGRPEITILRITVPPKVRLPMHIHPVINAGVLLKGELTITTEKNEEKHVKAGDALIEVVNKGHYGRNEGEVPAEIIVFYAGTQGMPISIKTSEVQ